MKLRSARRVEVANGPTATRRRARRTRAAVATAVAAAALGAAFVAPAAAVPVTDDVTLAYDRTADTFEGAVDLGPDCSYLRRVEVLRVRTGPDRMVGATIAASAGMFQLVRSVRPGRYYARVTLSADPLSPDCPFVRSRAVRVR